MNDPFADYGETAAPFVRTPPPKLTGPILTRAEARRIYGEIVGELRCCDDRETLDLYLMTIGEELLQFENELPYMWEGDGGDFIGIDGEIKAAIDRIGKGEFHGTG